jgi:uncharacterized protein YbjT (DUF2867 family)
MSKTRHVVMIGATGAVGGHLARHLARDSALHSAASEQVQQLTLLGRKPAEVQGAAVQQHAVNLGDAASYAQLLAGHSVGVCTVGIGQPSKTTWEEFVRVDHDMALNFARACKAAGVAHFVHLSSVGADSASASRYLKLKGQIEDGLRALNFERLSLFQPSVILTPTNRYDWVQGLTLAAMPLLKPLLLGSLRKYRGIEVHKLGTAMAEQVLAEPVLAAGSGAQTLHWDAITALAEKAH